MQKLGNYQYILILLTASIFCNSYGLYSKHTMKKNVEAAAERLNEAATDLMIKANKMARICPESIRNAIRNTAKHRSFHIQQHRLSPFLRRYQSDNLPSNPLSLEEKIYLTHIILVTHLQLNTYLDNLSRQLNSDNTSIAYA